MAIRTATEMKKHLMYVHGRPLKTNPYWYNSKIIAAFKNSVEVEIAGGELNPRAPKALRNWVDTLISTYLR